MTILGSDRGHLGPAEYEQLATRLALKETQIQDEDILKVVDTIANISENEKALLRAFQIVDPDGVFEYVRETPNSSVYSFLEYGGFLHDFLRSTELNESIKGLHTEGGYSGLHWNRESTGNARTGEARTFGWYHPLFVDGYLAWILVRGGAYDDFDGSQAEAKALGRQFERAVIGDRYESFYAWRLEDLQWSEWFWDVPHWDETLILADGDEKQLWLFMFTSTD